MKKTKFDFAAAILAGGKNRRMGGKNKAFMRIDNVPIIDRTLLLLEGLFSEVILVTNSVQEFRQLDRRIIITQDIIKDMGPLGGMYSGLCAASKQAVFFVACDMPFLHNDLIERLICSFNRIRPEALVPRSGSFIEPLHAILKTDLKGKLAAYLLEKNDSSIKGFLRAINTCYFDLGEEQAQQRIFKNLNTPQDLEMIGGYFAH